MSFEAMTQQIGARNGFVAALDQSGGSTPDALRQYGVVEADTSGDDAMFALMHDMRLRVMRAPAFDGRKVIGTILFEQTMNGAVEGAPIPTFLWERRRIVPFLKIDKGREQEVDGVKLMKPIPDLDALLARARGLGIFGTKMRSVITRPSRSGIAAAVAQQFELAGFIAERGLMPIIEPEVLIDAPERRTSETILLAELRRHLDALPSGRQVVLKLSIPVVADTYAALAAHPNVLCLLALSGGYSQAEACVHLAANHGMIGSFSRALLEDLRRDMPEAAFDGALARAVDRIYAASTEKP